MFLVLFVEEGRKLFSTHARTNTHTHTYHNFCSWSIDVNLGDWSVMW